MGHPVFVVAIRPETNEVVIGENEDLFTRRIVVNNFNFMSVDDIDSEVRLVGKIRYSHKGAPCVVKKIDNGFVECMFDEPQRAPTPGQALVLYDGDYVFGGGTIL